jgi:hypothetical protein
MISIGDGRTLVDLSSITAEEYLALKTTSISRMFNYHIPEKETSSLFNRKIYIYWSDGFDRAPDVCKICLDSWQSNNVGWDLEVLDADKANKVLPRESLPKTMSEAHYSDLLRLTLLAGSGGVWVDATVLCMRPLIDWMPLMVADSKIFVFSQPSQKRIISNWFIASHANCAIINELRDLVSNYWKNNRHAINYHFFHFLFEYLVHTSASCRNEWLMMPKLSAIPMHTLQSISGPYSSVDLENLQLYPMQKLNHNRGFNPNIIFDLGLINRAGI